MNRSDVPLDRALLDGGISAIELTLRTPSAFESPKDIREPRPHYLELGFTRIAIDSDLSILRKSWQQTLSMWRNPQ